MKEPSAKEAEKCLELRCQSKRGIRHHPENSAFIERMFDEYSEWYSATEKVVLARTAPFGSNITEEELDSQ